MIFIVWFNFIRLEQKELKPYKKVCKTKFFCGVVLPSEYTKILEFSIYWKPYQTFSVIYGDFESLVYKNTKETIKTISWRVKLIDSAKFVTRLIKLNLNVDIITRNILYLQIQNTTIYVPTGSTKKNLMKT